MLQNMKVVGPKFIFDKESHDRAHRAQKTTCVANGVYRKINDDVRSRIVLAHFIARGREESKQNLIFGMCLLDSLHDRPSLLEFSE